MDDGQGPDRAGGSGVRLRPIAPADLPHLHRWYQTPELSTHLVDDIPARTAEEAIGFMQRWLAPDPVDVRRAVVLAADGAGADGRLLGQAALLRVRDGEAELHLFLGDPQMRGQGHGRAAVEALLDLAFEALRLETVRLEVLGSNVAAQALYVAAGFERTGFRPGGVEKAGRWVEVVRMAVDAARRRPHR